MKDDIMRKLFDGVKSSFKNAIYNYFALTADELFNFQHFDMAHMSLSYKLRVSAK